MHLFMYGAQRVVTLIPTMLGLIILTFFCRGWYQPTRRPSSLAKVSSRTETLRHRHGFDQPS